MKAALRLNSKGYILCDYNQLAKLVSIFTVDQRDHHRMLSYLTLTLLTVGSFSDGAQSWKL